MSATNVRHRRLAAGLAVALGALTVPLVETARSADTPPPTSVAVAGSLQSEVGCPGDWQPDCAATELIFDAADGVWQASFDLPAGSFEYKVALNDSWDENYGVGGALNGANIPLVLAAPATVKFFYDHGTHWVTDNVGSIVATVPGSFQSELGCLGDWQPDCLRSWLQDPDGDGTYGFSTTAIPAGDYEAKVALDEKWDLNYGAGGVQDGPNIPFTVEAGDTVTFTWDSGSKVLTVLSEAPAPGQPDSVTIAGSLQSELGCAGDWDPACTATGLAFDADDTVWQGTFTVPAGSWEYKAALNGSWDENYGVNASPGGANIPLVLGAGEPVKFFYDHGTHWITDNVTSRIATAAGSFQSELGCPGDWQPDCLRSWLQDPDGDGAYTFSTAALPAGSYEFKVAIDEAWDVSYGAGGGNDNIPFTVPAAGDLVTISWNGTTNVPTVTVGAPSGLEPGDEELVRDPVRQAGQDEVVYFVMTDRFANGDPANDLGGSASADPLEHGFLPTDKGFYHGGDLAGLESKLDYLQGLGVTALWVTPPFTNRWVQGSGSDVSAGYHGYWQVDLTTIDPHLGSNQEMKDLIAAAQGLGMKVYFDIVANHTGDVIQYVGGQDTYRYKDDYPYLDADGNVFDDRDYAGTGTFPPLDPAISFPYVPTFETPADETVKAPDFLNNPIYYHNRGNSTFAGESSLYGDFFGLDDLFTEHPDVVTGMTEAHKAMITEFGIDGFRVDTVKHVNDEFWEAFVPAIKAHAGDDFVVFGEVFSGDPDYASRFSTELPFPATLDFRFDDAVKGAVAYNGPTDGLRTVFSDDDWFTDADSGPHGLVKFVGNHDLGRVGRDIDLGNPGASDAERLARATLVQVLNFTTRGVPVVYYGDEQGFTGDGGDKDARQDMFPSQVASYNDDDPIGTDATTADDNFDATHPLYQAISDLAGLRDAHLALRSGAQLHRYSEAGPGIYAFSRIERGEQVEYVVAVNTSEAADSASFATDSPSTAFTQIYPGGGPVLTSDAVGSLSVDVSALAAVVYRADAPVPTDTAPDGISVAAPAPGAEVQGRVEVRAAVTPGTYAEVTFAVSIGGSPYTVIGTDDSAPYAAHLDVSALMAGTQLTLKAIVADLGGNLNASNVDVTVQSLPCEVGSYSTTGSAPCTLAPPGYYVDTEGAIGPTPCPVGRYQDQAGQSSCIPAPIGYYVSAVAAVAATSCPPGTTTLAEGATSDGFCVADAYRFTGFSAPVDNDGVLNQVKAGQTVPLKWRLTTTDGLPVTDLDLADVRVTVSGLSCSTGVSVDALEEYTAGSSGLQNLGDGYYQWNWKTPRTYAGSCKTMKLSLGEVGDATHDALFRFTK